MSDDFEADLDAWARHAAAANGFGDASCVPAPRARASTYDMWHAARGHHAWALGYIVETGVRMVVHLVRRARMRVAHGGARWSSI